VNKIKKDDKNSIDLSQLSKNLAREIFHLDRNIPATVFKLMTRPGYLTRAFFYHPKEKWVQPFKLYLAINLLFFIITPLLNSSNFEVFSFDVRSRIRLDDHFNKKVEHACSTHQISKEIYIERFNDHIKYNQPALLFLLIPFWGLLLQILSILKNVPFSLHLTHAMHLLAYLLLLLLCILGIYQGLAWILNVLNVSDKLIDMLIVPTIGIGFLIYLFRSIRLVYEDKIPWAVLKTTITFAGFIVIFGGYVNFLFHYTYFALNLGY